MNKLVWMMTIAMALPALTIATEKSPDESFYKEAAEGGLAEVQQGQLAQQKGTRAAVKEFGSRMVQDHSAANDKLKTVADAKGIKLPGSPGAMQMASIGKLKLLSGDAFDKAYIKGMVKDHEDDIAAFEKEVKTGKDPDAKQFAASTLPTLKTHLNMIRSIASSAGIDTN
jgi:putative membrane protein